MPAGPVGAGTGATVGKWRGPDQARPGGIGSAARHHGDLVVAALMAVNAFGDLRTPGARPPRRGAAHPLANTTIGVVATNATLDKVGCLLVAQSAHDGLARALEPAHTTVDGDAIVAAAVGGVAAPLDQVRILAAQVVEDAIRAAVGRRLSRACSVHRGARAGTGAVIFPDLASTIGSRADAGRDTRASPGLPALPAGAPGGPRSSSARATPTPTC